MAKPGRPQPPFPPSRSTPTACSRFVNTLSGRPTAAPAERLVVVRRAGGLGPRAASSCSAAAADRLAAEARRHPQQAAAVLARAKDFREALNLLAVAIEHGRQPAPAVLATISDCLAVGVRPRPPGAARRRRCNGSPAPRTISTRILWEIGRAAGTAGGLAAASAASARAQPRLRLVVRRRHEEPFPPLVRYEDLWESREGQEIPESCLRCVRCVGCLRVGAGCRCQWVMPPVHDIRWRVLTS